MMQAIPLNGGAGVLRPGFFHLFPLLRQAGRPDTSQDAGICQNHRGSANGRDYFVSGGGLPDDTENGRIIEIIGSAGAANKDHRVDNPRPALYRG